MADRSTDIEQLRNPDVRYEVGDVNARALTKFGMGMFALIVVFLFGLWGLFEYLKEQAGLVVAAQVVGSTAQNEPPEPRLQRHPAQDMQDMRAAEDRILGRYAWIDSSKGIVQIPVARAMELTALRGLPVLSNASATTGEKKP
jgi:hypothetical protein